METDDITMMWDITIPNARKIGANRSDICFRNRKTNTCILIDISCPADGNIARKHAEKLTKYSDLRVEVSRMDTGCSSGIGIVAHSARRLDIIPAHHNLQHLQKAVLLGSCRILHKVMSSV